MDLAGPGEELAPLRLATARLPSVAAGSPERVPQLEDVAELLRLTGAIASGTPVAGRPTEARLLAAVLEVDSAEGRGNGRVALSRLREDARAFDPDVLDPIETLPLRRPEVIGDEGADCRLRVGRLAPGTRLSRDVFLADGVRLAWAGSEITQGFISYLSNREQQGLDTPELWVPLGSEPFTPDTSRPGRRNPAKGHG